MAKFDAMLDPAIAPETFVRQSLQMLETDVRRLALVALADWQRTEIVSLHLFLAVAALQRPSWGHWNGLRCANPAAK